MKVKEKNNVVVFKQSNEDYTAFVNKIIEQEHIFKNKNIIIDLEHTDLSLSELALFKELADKQRENKKSFVIISKINSDDIADDLIVVPSVQEGFDLIEMEEIERDLGF